MSDASDRPATGTHCQACGYTSVNPSRRCPSCGARREQPSGTALPPPLPGTHATDDPPFLRRRLLVGGAALLLVAGVVTYTLSGDDDGAARFGSSGRPVAIPEQLEQTWTREFDGPGSAAVIGDRVLVAFVPWDEGQIVRLTAYDQFTGDEEWSVDLEDASGAKVVSTKPLVVEWLGGGSDFAHLARLSPEDGSIKWDVEIAPGRAHPMGGELYVIPKYLDPSNPQPIRDLRLVDLDDGSIDRAVTADRDISLVGDELVGHDEDSITVYDPHTLEAQGDPVTIDDDAEVVTLWGDLVVSAETDQLTAASRSGTLAWTIDSPVDTVYSLTPIGELLIVDGDEGLSAVRRTPIGIEEVWHVEAGFDSALPAFDLVVARTGTELRFLEVDKGEEVMTVSRVSIFGRVEAFANGVLVSGIDVTGYRAFLMPGFEQGWDVGRGAPTVTPDGVVVVERHDDGDDIGDDTITVTAYR